MNFRMSLSNPRLPVSSKFLRESSLPYSDQEMQINALYYADEAS